MLNSPQKIHAQRWDAPAGASIPAYKYSYISSNCCRFPWQPTVSVHTTNSNSYSTQLISYLLTVCWLKPHYHGNTLSVHPPTIQLMGLQNYVLLNMTHICGESLWVLTQHTEQPVIVLFRYIESTHSLHLFRLFSYTLSSCRTSTMSILT